MHGFAGQANLAVWYARADVAELREQFRAKLSRQANEKADRVMAKARTWDSMQALGKLTRLEDGRPRIVADPPLVVPADDLVPPTPTGSGCKPSSRPWSPGTGARWEPTAATCWSSSRWRTSPAGGRRGQRRDPLLDRLMLGRDSSDPLFLQVKEAGPSVLEDFAGPTKYANHGQRVVAGQRLMQAASDIFLGWPRSRFGPGTASYDFYIRQLRDWKASAHVATMAPAAMRAYGQLCGWTLARAHAPSGDRIPIAAYLGRSAVFDQAVGEFAAAYADQNERDHRALARAVKAGRVVAERGV